MAFNSFLTSSLFIQLTHRFQQIICLLFFTLSLHIHVDTANLAHLTGQLWRYIPNHIPTLEKPAGTSYPLFNGLNMAIGNPTLFDVGTCRNSIYKLWTFRWYVTYVTLSRVYLVNGGGLVVYVIRSNFFQNRFLCHVNQCCKRPMASR